MCSRWNGRATLRGSRGPVSGVLGRGRTSGWRAVTIRRLARGQRQRSSSRRAGTGRANGRLASGRQVGIVLRRDPTNWLESASDRRRCGGVAESPPPASVRCHGQTTWRNLADDAIAGSGATDGDEVSVAPGIEIVRLSGCCRKEPLRKLDVGMRRRTVKRSSNR